MGLGAKEGVGGVYPPKNLGLLGNREDTKKSRIGKKHGKNVSCPISCLPIDFDP